ncbi:MAG: hypothetical protein KGJ23_01245 [Euryarchaeota archaeon]|nr:hypothetical protein [Euryarchaeota archaeon]MDE1835223.1 hypothetical protein [Euryarchaeota archaeon]MDE1880080.1 hypothetical protein [Euryarchaeota archaeon]MDE2043519.1 hypothetical protein [Thermoplasmata archaeon]
MMLDWAVSVLVVSLIVFGLVVISLAFFQNVDHNYVLRNALSSTAHTVADQVDRVEGIAASTNQPFLYNETVGGSGTTVENGVAMPTTLAGSRYTVDFTHDFVVTVSNGSGPLVGTYLDLTKPVHLFPENMTHTIERFGTTQYHLNAMDQVYKCTSFPSGVNFNATVALVFVDGFPTYLTFVYAFDGASYSCT